MTSVLALDLDVTKAGVALPTGRTLTLTAPTLNRTTNHGHRLTWWNHHLHQLITFYQPTIVAAEAIIPTPGRTSTALKAGIHAIAHLHTHTVGATWVDTIYPSQLKKWATGHGDANKGAMLAEAVARGANPTDDDQADAALLRYMILEVADSPEALRRWLARR